MKVVPLDAPLGARIEGICWQDATRPDVGAVLNKALGEYLLVVVPGQPMTAPLMRDFASAFGKPRAQLLRYKRNDEVPEVSTMVSTLMADGTTDKTALLHNMEPPSHGGRTWFCNMHSVYEALPESTRKRIDGKRAIHAYDTARARNRPSTRTAQEIAETPDVEHPLVRTHPDTGRKALYLNFNRLDRIVGLERAESDALLDELATDARKPRHHFGHQWTVGDCVVWDNRATMHRVDVDYPMGERRIMQRVLIEGDQPF